MGDLEQVRYLVEEALNSGRTPEEVCATHPECLEEVRMRWLRIQDLAGDVDRLFPSIGRPPPRHADLGETEALPRIPGYELEAAIGHGGMGVVYKARHIKLDRIVAVKMLLFGDHASAKELAGLMREAQAVAGLKHSHIVQVHDFGELDGLPYFTMEYLEGGSLARKLDGKPMPVREAAALLATLATAVQAAHSGGIVHRDLKPGNIMLGADGAPKITDFGLARRTQGDPGHTLSAARVGTPSYMAPEQALGTPGAFGPSVDIYALGAILYETLTGRPPFRSESAVETQRQVVEEEPAAPSRLNARVPRDLETVCLKCLHKDPQRRYPTAAALAEDLQRFLDGVPVTARRIGPLGRAGMWARRRPAHAALVVGCVLVLFGLAALAVSAAWRRAETSRAVQGDLRQAIEREHALDWSGAHALLERARGRLGGAATESLRGAIKQLDDDLALVARLEKVRLDRARFGNPPRSLANAEATREYQAALQGAGLVDLSEAPEVSVAAIQRSEIRDSVRSALDDWVWCGGEQRPRVVQVLLGLDPDPWRNQVRRAAGSSNKADLELLATTAPPSEQPSTLLLALGRSLHDAGGDGARLLRAAQEQHPADFWANYQLGLTLNFDAKYTEAIGYLRAAIAIRPDIAPARFYLGYAFMSLKRWDEAIREYERVVEAAPDFGPARLNLGRCLQGKLRWEDSVVQFREVLRMDPNDAEAHDNLGISLGILRHMSEAIAEGRESLRIDPTISHAHSNLASSLETVGDREGAIAEYEESLRLDANNFLAHLSVGRLIRDKGQFPEALPHFQQAIAIDPKHTAAKNDLRGVRIRLGEVEQVRVAWHQDLEAEPSDHPSWDGYAELCLFLGREADYRRTCQALLDRFADTQDAHVAERTGRACLLLPASEEQVAQAAALIDRAMAADWAQYEDWAPPFFMFAKGLADYRQNHFEDTLTVMQGKAATVMGPSPGIVRAMALHRLGQQQEARKEFASAIALFQWDPANADIRDAWVHHILRREAETMILPNLPAFLEGKYQPLDNDERCAMLGACQFKQRFAAIAGLYADAFAADPTLAEGLRTGRRYFAACAAAQAASGRGAEPVPLTPEEQTRWREQARQWLLADLTLLGTTLRDAKEQDRERIRQFVAQYIQYWRLDKQLAGVRDQEELNKLPAEEREKCLAVWTEAETLLRRAEEAK